MTVLNQMLEMRDKFVEQDRIDAMKKIIWQIHYEIAPRVEDKSSFILFQTENEIVKFCKNNNLDIRALKWLIKSMKSEYLIDECEMPVKLTPLAIEKFCM